MFISHLKSIQLGAKYLHKIILHSSSWANISSAPFINLITFYQYGLIDIYFIYLIIMKHYCSNCSCMIMGIVAGGSTVPLTYSHHCSVYVGVCLNNS